MQTRITSTESNNLNSELASPAQSNKKMIVGDIKFKGVLAQTESKLDKSSEHKPSNPEENKNSSNNQSHNTIVKTNSHKPNNIKSSPRKQDSLDKEEGTITEELHRVNQ